MLAEAAETNLDCVDASIECSREGSSSSAAVIPLTLVRGRAAAGSIGYQQLRRDAHRGSVPFLDDTVDVVSQREGLAALVGRRRHRVACAKVVDVLEVDVL